MECKIHSIVITLWIFASALIVVVEMPSTFENVLAQQLEGNQQYRSISSSQQSSSEDGIRESDRTPEVEEQRNSLELLINRVGGIPEGQQCRGERGNESAF